jgi:hypothetical protein
MKALAVNVVVAFALCDGRDPSGAPSAQYRMGGRIGIPDDTAAL